MNLYGAFVELARKEGCETALKDAERLLSSLETMADNGSEAERNHVLELMRPVTNAIVAIFRMSENERMRV
jgi:hypothetical protein